MAEEKKKDRPAELDAADKTVREAGGVPTEIFFRDDGQIQVSFVIHRGGSDHVHIPTSGTDRSVSRCCTISSVDKYPESSRSHGHER